MTVEQLINRLKMLPEDAEATYLHNVSGVISIDEIEHRETQNLQGKKFDIVVLRGAKGEDE